MVNGTLYFATPDNAWAVDARTGGGIHIGNRGMGMYGNWLFFETPDNYLVSLDAKTGKERWHKEIADVKQEYFSTSAPVWLAIT
jgi:alcohol dehydrogenase (cytochrome c)